MQQAEQVAYIERMLAMARANTRDDGEISHTSVEEYFDPDRFEREKAMLRRNPVVVAFSAQLRKPGDFVANDDSGQPVLVPGQGAELDMDAFLGPVETDLQSWDMHGGEVQSTTPLRPRMNWKLVIDTFLELYHFRYLHGASVAPLFLDNITAYERRGR